MDSLTAFNVNDAFSEMIWKMRIFGVSEDSRNGHVRTIPQPFGLTILRPWQRVLFDPVRQANPFFHVMEFIWMMAGSRKVEWIAQFNSRMHDYADDGIIKGAYGYRWANQWGMNQIGDVVGMLEKDPTTRRAVLAMWDPDADLFSDSKDIPCNTHIYFRIYDGELCMTVCNRSNDLIWGMLGANAVHMTMLHELVARSLETSIGRYHVLTNNLHVYTDLPNYEELMTPRPIYDPYSTAGLEAKPLLRGAETLDNFIEDACRAIYSDEGFNQSFVTDWFNTVAHPMYFGYMERKLKEGDGVRYFRNIEAPDWKRAAILWTEWKDGKHSDSRS